MGGLYPGRMLLAAVPQVDVVPDGFDWWNGLSGTGGLLAAIVAIVIAGACSADS